MQVQGNRLFVVPSMKGFAFIELYPDMEGYIGGTFNAPFSKSYYPFH